MKKVIAFLFLMALFSCEKPQCKICLKYYDAPIASKEFTVCSFEEFNYWNGKQYIEYIYGVHTEVTVVCK
jgi:hypothetical protein